MGKTPFPPYEKRLLPAKFGAGMDQGKTKRTGNTVWHRMVGTLWGTDAYFRLSWVEASTHWGIGGSLDGNDDGTIIQWVEIGSDFIPWASGPWRAPGYEEGQEYVNEFGIYGINAYADSMEFSGLAGTAMTILQWQKGIWLTAAIVHDGGRDSEEYLWNMQHREFCQPSYKDCPFAAVYKYTNEYQNGIVKILQHYEGKAMREEFVSIAGLKVPLPIYQEPTKPADQTPVFVSFPKPRKARLYAASERQYGNTTAKIYATYKSGTELWFLGYYEGQTVAGDNRWYVVENDRKGRIHSSGIREWLPDEPNDNKLWTPDVRAKFSREIRNRDFAGSHWM